MDCALWSSQAWIVGNGLGEDTHQDCLSSVRELSHKSNNIERGLAIKPGGRLV